MFSKLINRIMKLAELICMLLLGIAVIFVTLQIVFRYFLSSPLGWTEQTSRFCFIWIVMLGIPIMFYRKCEISFDFIREKMPEKLHNIVLLVFDLLAIFFCVLYCIYSMSLCIRTGGRLTSGIAVPLNCLYAVQPISAVLTLLVFVERVKETLKLKKGGE